jgi:hypothetical protein
VTGTETSTGFAEVSERALPDPASQPVMRLWPEVGEWLSLSKTSTYQAAARGEIPTIRLGRKLMVPTAAFRRLVGLD